MNAFVGSLHRRRIVEKEKDSSNNLDDKEEETDASKVIPERELVLRNLLFPGECEERRELEA
jgi:hypothetical protein